MAKKQLPASADVPYPSIVDITLDNPRLLQPDDKLPSAESADLAVMNDMLRLCYAVLPAATSIAAVCQVISQTLNVVEARRKALGLSYGDKSDKKGRNDWLDPIPD